MWAKKCNKNIQCLMLIGFEGSFTWRKFAREYFQIPEQNSLFHNQKSIQFIRARLNCH